MDTNEPFPPSTALKAIHTSLHLLYHRNKNQHRNTKWWKWLSMLRRATADLTREVERFEKDDDDDDEGAREIVLRRMGAFSTVVADTQFSALGVVLIASLAQVSQAVRAGESYSSSPPDTADDVMAAAPSHRVDVGEVVKRSAYTPVLVGSALGKTGAGGIGSSLSGVEGEGETGRTKRERSVVERLEREGKRGEGREREKGKEKEKEKKRKKKKKGNAIDDIFGGL
ncbi:hypothetical protein FQN55_007536 [Onygenales sp. PD_40]|nr:hypothetical protein FQN55_007536 [Onygenales sp. PD_40]